jgi:hypothetical protein
VFRNRRPMEISAGCAIWDTRMTRATAVTGGEVGLPRLSAVHALSCMDDPQTAAGSCTNQKCAHRQKRTLLWSYIASGYGAHKKPS